MKKCHRDLQKCESTWGHAGYLGQLYMDKSKGSLWVIWIQGPWWSCWPFIPLPQRPVSYWWLQLPFILLVHPSIHYSSHVPRPIRHCLVCRTTSHRHTVPLVPVTGHGEMMQIIKRLLRNFVILVDMSICGEAEILQSLGLGVDNIGDETLGSVLRQGASHPHLSCLVHQGPGHGGPLRPQQSNAGEVPDTALDESLAPLIATKMPEFIHQGSVGDIQGWEFKHLLVAMEVPREKVKSMIIYYICSYLCCLERQTRQRDSKCKSWSRVSLWWHRDRNKASVVGGRKQGAKEKSAKLTEAWYIPDDRGGGGIFLSRRWTCSKLHF